MMSRSFAVLAGVFSLAAAQFQCPDATTAHFKDPADCTKYITCYGGLSYEQQCPDGKYFNDVAQYCDIPANVDCVVNPCPPASNQLDFLPLENDCTGYTLCINGEAYPIACAAGTLFDEAYGDCVAAQASSCRTNPCIEAAATGAPPTQFFADESSCTRYAICNKDVPLYRDCTTGTVFNRDIGKCDMEANWVCPLTPPVTTTTTAAAPVV